MATGFWNTILPMAILTGFAVLLPSLLTGRHGLSHRHLLRAILLTALLTLILGALISAGLYARINPGTLEHLLQAPVERSVFFLGRSALFALLWGPVLGFVWLVKAQELNRRAGLRMVDEGGRG
ncbi:MAG: hypothetical protein JNK34_05915 [Tabrizicola sp.]|nr:hypothetical protein [Tabrizicola sp.]